MKRIVRLNHSDYKRSVKFAMKLWYAGKPKGDWRSTGTKRDIGKYITDHALGKLAEIAFAKFLEMHWGIKAELDFDIHPGPLAIDQGDLVAVEVNGNRKIPKIKIDIKSTKPSSLWSMVDFTEFNNRLYETYIWVKVDLPLNHLARPIFDAVQNGNLIVIKDMIPALEEIDAEIVGFAHRNDVDKWPILYRGEVVFDPEKPKRKLFTAKTDNKVCPIGNLKKAECEWNKLVQKIIGN